MSLVKNKLFKSQENFSFNIEASYRWLPFNFHRLPSSKIFLSNICGENFVCEENIFQDFISNNLKASSQDYKTLKSKHFLIEDDATLAVELLALKLRTKMKTL